jgi:hypothetical protein
LPDAARQAWQATRHPANDMTAGMPSRKISSTTKDDVFMRQKYYK